MLNATRGLTEEAGALRVHLCRLREVSGGRGPRVLAPPVHAAPLLALPVAVPQTFNSSKLWSPGGLPLPMALLPLLWRCRTLTRSWIFRRIES